MRRSSWALVFSLALATAAACSAAGGGPNGASSGGASASGGANASGGSNASGGAHPSGGANSDASATGGAGPSGGSSATGGSSASGGSGIGGSGASGGSSTGGSGPVDAGYDGPPPGSTTVVIGPGANSSSPGKFGGSATGPAPTIVYPANGIIVPPNMNSLEFHFIPGAGQTLFEFQFVSGPTKFIVYTGCTPLGPGCVFTPDKSFWYDLGYLAKGAPPVTYTIRGVNAQNPGAVGTSATQKMTFATDPIIGGLYYWNTKGYIQRYDFGHPTATAEQYMTPALAGAIFCVGCHAISRNGTEIAVGKDIPAPAPYTVYDVATRQPIIANGNPVKGSADFFSFSPDGSKLLYSGGVNIGWRSMTTGAVINANITSGTMPDWSPDGSSMVFAKPQQSTAFTNPSVASASIVLLHLNGQTWGNPVTLVPFQGKNNYYPAFSPDNNWVLFNRSPSNEPSYQNASPDPEAGTVPDGQLWIVPSSGGTAHQLAAATDGNAASWPKWVPEIAHYYGGTIMWFTYSSARAYGLRLAAGKQVQLWMTAFDPAKEAAGQDGSFPSFWLPFQDINGGNHIAQWTTKVQRQPCTQSSQCPIDAIGQICQDGKCVPAPH